MSGDQKVITQVIIKVITYLLHTRKMKGENLFLACYMIECNYWCTLRETGVFFV